MRTNIDIDDELMNNWMKAAGASTKREAVEKAMRIALQIHGQTGIRRLRGKIHWEGDLSQSRLGRNVD